MTDFPAVIKITSVMNDIPPVIKIDDKVYKVEE